MMGTEKVGAWVTKILYRGLLEIEPDGPRCCPMICTQCSEGAGYGYGDSDGDGFTYEDQSGDGLDSDGEGNGW